MRSRSLSSRLVVAGVALVVPAGPAGSAERPWIEVRTPHFVVIGNAGEGAARDMGGQFEQIHYVFGTLWPWARRESGRPFIVFVVKGESDMKALAPKYWEEGRDGTAGVAVTGPDRDYVALKAGVELRDDIRTNPYFFAYWGYANRMLESTFPVSLPPWFRRGLSDLIGNTHVRGKDVLVGRLINHHLERLAQPHRLTLQEIISADDKSKYVDNEALRPTFDAHAWMFCHYLTFGDNGSHQAELSRFAGLMREGREANAAFRESFPDLEGLGRGFNTYMTRKLYAYATIKGDLNVKAEGFAVRQLAPAEAAAMRAAFHAAMGRPREARALLDEARKADPKSAIVSEVDAVMLDGDKKTEEAVAAYERATDGGSQSYYAYYRLATLLRRPTAPKENLLKRAKALEQAVRLNPDHAWSHASLSRVLSDLEPGERAIEAAKKAVSLEPGEVSHRLALVSALSKASRPEDARQQVQAAQAIAMDEEDRGELQKWIAYLNQEATPSTQPAQAGAGAKPTASQAEWLAEACEAGTADACAALASSYEQGIGVPKDLARAAALFEKACSLSDLEVCAYLARRKMEGKPSPKDLAAAMEFATKACDGGRMDGCTTLALVHVKRSTPKDLARARALLEKACAGGDANACQLRESLRR